MKGLLLDKIGGTYEVVDNLEKPVPGPGQVLVKSIAVAINPVDTLMQASGLLVTHWPIVLGCDAGAEVVAVGEGVTSLKTGDNVCGCTRLGVPGHSTFQEYHLMDAALTIKTPSNVSVTDSAALGVGSYTAALAVFRGFELTPPDLKTPVEPKDEWVLVFGGAGSVGQYAVQLAKILGFKVVATCSARTSEVVKAVGADATIDYSQPIAAQMADLEKITGGNVGKVFDAVARNTDIAFEALTKHSKTTKKYFTTVDDWSPMNVPDGVDVFRISLGPIGRTGKDAEQVPYLNDALESYIPRLTQYIESGALKPNEVEVVGKGFETILKAIDLCNSGKGGGKKFVVLLE